MCFIHGGTGTRYWKPISLLFLDRPLAASTVTWLWWVYCKCIGVALKRLFLPCAYTYLPVFVDFTISFKAFVSVNYWLFKKKSVFHLFTKAFYMLVNVSDKVCKHDFFLKVREPRLDTSSNVNKLLTPSFILLL